MKRILALALTAALLLACCAAHTPAQTPAPPAASTPAQTPAAEPDGAESTAIPFTAATTVAEVEADPAFAVRLACCLSCGIAAGLLVHAFYRGKPFFDFTGFEPRPGRDTDPNPLLRFLKNLGRNLKATGPWFLVGVLLSALFQRYVPADGFAALFGCSEGFGVLLAATIGVPLYACGGGTIPLLQQWLAIGMSMGSAAAFMVTGPATKITNLGALKIVLGLRRFCLYLAFVMAFAFGSGMVVNWLV